MIMDEKLSFPEAGRRLSLAPSTLNYWVKASKTVYRLLRGLKSSDTK